MYLTIFFIQSWIIEREQRIMRKQEWSWKIIVVEVIYTCKRLLMGDELNRKQFSLKWPQKKDVCKWVHELKVLHGWASNLCKCVDKKYLTLFGIKGHDYDIFLRCIIPVAFNALQKTIGKPLTKFSMFIKELCSTVLPEDKLGIWKKTFN